MINKKYKDWKKRFEQSKKAKEDNLLKAQGTYVPPPVVERTPPQPATETDTGHLEWETGAIRSIPHLGYTTWHNFDIEPFRGRYQTVPIQYGASYPQPVILGQEQGVTFGNAGNDQAEIQEDVNALYSQRYQGQLGQYVNQGISSGAAMSLAAGQQGQALGIQNGNTQASWGYAYEPYINQLTGRTGRNPFTNFFEEESKSKKKRKNHLPEWW